MKPTILSDFLVGLTRTALAQQSSVKILYRFASLVLQIAPTSAVRTVAMLKGERPEMAYRLVVEQLS